MVTKRISSYNGCKDICNFFDFLIGNSLCSKLDNTVSLDPKVLQLDTPPLPIMVTGPFMMVTVMLSMILLGIASLKSKVFSTAPAILLILAPIINFVPIFSNYSVLACGIPFMWFGIEAVKKSRGNISIKTFDDAKQI